MGSSSLPLAVAGQEPGLFGSLMSKLGLGQGTAQTVAPATKMFGDRLPQAMPVPVRNPLFSGSIDKPSAGPIETVQGQLLTPGAPMPSLLPKPPGEPEADPAAPAMGKPRMPLSKPVSEAPAGAPQTFDTSAPAAPAAPAAAGGLFGKGGMIEKVQEALKGAPMNPLFQVGMGIASSGFDGSNPYAAISKNLNNIPALQQAQLLSQLKVNADNREQSKSEREAEDARNQQELALMLAKISQQYATPQTEGTSRIARGAKVIR